MLNLTRWNPVDELTRLHREMDRMFSRVWGGGPVEVHEALPWRGASSWQSAGTFVPPTELISEPDAWHARLALPGVDPKDVDVEITGNVLTVSGERHPAPAGEGQTQFSEIGYGRFERRFTLPARIDSGAVQASFRNGLLELRLPLEEAARPRRIEIAAGDGKQLAA